MKIYSCARPNRETSKKIVPPDIGSFELADIHGSYLLKVVTLIVNLAVRIKPYPPREGLPFPAVPQVHPPPLCNEAVSSVERTNFAAENAQAEATISFNLPFISSLV